MPSHKIRIPTYRLHRASGRAVVTLDGQDHYLGEHNSPESHREYKRVINEWLARGGVSPTVDKSAELVVNEIVVAYIRYAESYYCDAQGNTTLEVPKIKNTLKIVSEMYGEKSAEEFGPLALKAVRQTMIDRGLCRKQINARVGLIKRVFKWASSEELITPTIYHGLLSVEGLRRGRCGANESKPVKPVDDAVVEATLPYLCPTVRAMVQVQQLSGMRSGELVIMRPIDIDMNSDVWFYTPPHHKTLHHEHTRVIPLGPKAQEILKPFLADDPTEYVFSPKSAQEERNAAKRAARKSKVQPSQISRAKTKPQNPPRERYETKTYRSAVLYGIRKAAKAGVNIPDWHPYQLRHTAATRIRKSHSLDAARAVLGQKTLAIADTYAELDAGLASAVAAAIG